jgi:hypothetical protein
MLKESFSQHIINGLCGLLTINPKRNSIRKWSNILSSQTIYINYKESFRTSQRTHGAYIIKTNQCCTVDKVCLS